jgi:carbamoyl-phosphate synthase large subunit
MEIVELERPEGIIVQFGGQTPLKLARKLEAAGAPIIGTSPDSIDLAEDRERFQKLVNELELRQPANRTARNVDDAVRLAEEIGYPLVVRPSYVLGGRAMEVVFFEDELRTYMQFAVKVSEDSPILLDRFLDNAVEVDIDIVSDGEARWSSAASWSTSSRPACTPATPAAACRPTPSIPRFRSSCATRCGAWRARSASRG